MRGPVAGGGGGGGGGRGGGFYSLWFAKSAKARRDWWLCRRVVGRTRVTVTATHAGSGAGAMAATDALGLLDTQLIYSGAGERCQPDPVLCKAA